MAEHPPRTLKRKKPLENKSFERFSNGGGWHKLLEPRSVTVCREYGVLWKRLEIDLGELKRLRQGRTIEQLAAHFDCGTTKIKKRLRLAGTRARAGTGR
jgi:hypothetical protein